MRNIHTVQFLPRETLILVFKSSYIFLLRLPFALQNLHFYNIITQLCGQPLRASAVFKINKGFSTFQRIYSMSKK